MAATVGELNIQIAANVAQLSQDVTKVEREMRKMRTAGVKASKQMDVAAKAVTGFKKLAIGAGAAIVAIRGLTRALSSSLAAFEAQEDAEKKLETALGRTSNALLDQAAALQQVSKFGDETIIEAQALIAAFVEDEEQIKAATKATLDLAAAKGMDLKAAADLVSKTLGSSTNALSRYGIQVEGAVGSTERLQSTVENISAVFGGQAAAQAETMGGRIQQMKNAFGDLQETVIGFAGPTLTKFAENMKLGIEVIDRFVKKLKETGGLREGVSFEERQKRGRARAEAARKADVQARRDARVQRELERIEENGKIIEEEQQLLQARLEVDALNDAAEERFHNNKKRRADEEIRLNRNRRDSALSTASAMLNSVATLAQAGNASFRTQKAIAIATGTVDAIRAALSAFSSTPYPYNFIAAGLTFAAGIARVSSIRSTNVGGGSAGGSFGAAPAPPPEPDVNLDSLLERQGGIVGGGTQTTIVFQGGTFIGGDKEQVARELVPAVEKALQDGQR
jgi:hypothetical protein